MCGWGCRLASHENVGNWLIFCHQKSLWRSLVVGGGDGGVGGICTLLENSLVGVGG